MQSDAVHGGNARLKLLSDIASELLLSDKPREILAHLFDRLSAHLGLEIYFNYLIEEGGEYLRLNSFGGISPAEAERIARIGIGEAICGMAAARRQRFVLENLQRVGGAQAALVRRLGITAYVCHPLVAHGRLLGTLSFGTGSRLRFTDDELDLLQTVSNQIAAALERERMMAELERRAAEQARAMAQAESANRAKDHFLATLSHELRTPLTPVLTLVQALESEMGMPEEFLPFLEIIRRNVELEVLLIDDLLDLTRIARGKLQFTLADTDLHGILRHVLEIYRREIAEKNLTVRFEPAAADSVVHGDTARLQQVFWNLLKNAVKFTPAGGTVILSTCNAGPGRVCVEVADTGIGIEPGLLPRIFDAFEQGRAATAARFGGLGLGLAISKAIVDRHGGSIRARSEGPGRGATFEVILETAGAKGPEPFCPA